MSHEATIENIEISAFTVPTKSPESDGTFEWHATTLVLVHATGGGKTGIGYSYADVSTAHLIEQALAPRIKGMDAFANTAAWREMCLAIHNLGRPGISSMAISAVDNALWDLKGKLLDLSVAALCGLARTEIMAYGSGGFTSYTEKELIGQMSGWAGQGLRAVKMKIGRDAAADVKRVELVRKAIGPNVQFFVDANGAYTRKQAFYQARHFAESGVTWFEEPVSSDDLDGLRLIRDYGPEGMSIAAGEYGYDSWYFRRMRRARWMCNRPTPRAARESRASCRPTRCATAIPCRYPRTARHLFMRMPAARRSAPSTRNTSSITFALKRWHSMTHAKQTAACCVRILQGQGSA
jgi:L-alanine-DL-glutamate epimerase-like enolase superfamily enzyme